MEVKATARYVRVAPNKARQVVAHIRGLGVDDARRTLSFSPKEVSTQILKTLNSAVANAEHNNDLDADDLVVTRAIVDEGPMLKRYQPRAMGRAYRIRKRTSHITIVVGVPAVAVAAPPAPTAGATARGGAATATASAGTATATAEREDEQTKRAEAEAEAEITDSATAEDAGADTEPSGEEE